MGLPRFVIVIVVDKDAFLQNDFQSLFSDPVPEMHQFGGFAWVSRLEGSFSAEILVPRPACQEGCADASNSEARPSGGSVAGTSHDRAIERTDAVFDLFPIYPVRKNGPGMLLVCSCFLDVYWARGIFKDRL